ncbi:MAG: hypothetical protein HW421_1808 [Ignavibacteria bacterium]|nr:hypothetical protein [Ignavibacteria bacterium]
MEKIKEKSKTRKRGTSLMTSLKKVQNWQRTVKQVQIKGLSLSSTVINERYFNENIH